LPSSSNVPKFGLALVSAVGSVVVVSDKERTAFETDVDVVGGVAGVMIFGRAGNPQRGEGA
jgi:hypothetical protein